MVFRPVFLVPVLLLSQEIPPDPPDEPEQDPAEREVRAVHRRWLGAAAGKDVEGLLEHLYALRSRQRRSEPE
jgi:hypothetical protein